MKEEEDFDFHFLQCLSTGIANNKQALKIHK
jgi:hypothetical protein